MPSGRKKRSIVYPGDMNFRQRGDEILRLRRLLRAANKRTRDERALWDEKCPKGHLRRHNECDLMCEIADIGPPPRLEFDKKAFDLVYHSWIQEEPERQLQHLTNWGALVTKIYEQFDINLVEQQTGWWVRYPYALWLKLKGWFHEHPEVS